MNIGMDVSHFARLQSQRSVEGVGTEAISSGDRRIKRVPLVTAGRKATRGSIG
jgi:hypothetical protein